MRLFIAIEIPKAIRSELSKALRELRSRSSGGRFTPENDLHITLHFIGESDDLMGAVNAVKAACAGIRPFVLKPNGYDYFEKGERKTSYITVSGDTEELCMLREKLESALSDNGFARDYHKFIPHITLGRNVEHDELVSMEMRDIAFNQSFTVSGVTLFESVKENGRMVYNPLHREKL